MNDPSPGVNPPPPGTPPIGVSQTSDNPAAPNAGAPAAPPAWSQQGYGAPPPPPPPPKQPNPFVANLKAELIGAFPTPTDAPQGKLWAILCYLPGVVIPLWLIPLVRRTNHLSLFHAKQMLGFAALQIPASVGVLILGFFLRKLGMVGSVFSGIFSVLLGLTILAIAVIGLLGAIKGQVKPLPLIGRIADRLLRSLTVCPLVPNAEPQLAYWLRVAPVAPGPHPHAPPQPMPMPGSAQPQAAAPPGPAPQPAQSEPPSGSTAP